MTKEFPERIEGCPDSMSTPDFKKFKELEGGIFMRVIIGYSSNSDLEKLKSHLYIIGVEDKRINKINGLRKICVELEKSQIFEIANLSYVNSVIEDQIIFGYHTPKKD